MENLVFCLCKGLYAPFFDGQIARMKQMEEVFNRLGHWDYAYTFSRSELDALNHFRNRLNHGLLYESDLTPKRMLNGE